MEPLIPSGIFIALLFVYLCFDYRAWKRKKKMKIAYLKKNNWFIHEGTMYQVDNAFKTFYSPLKTKCGVEFKSPELEVELKSVEPEPFNTKDALGREIMITGDYGYSAHQNGITIVRLGRAVKFTKTGLLTLEIYDSKSAAYNNELTESPLEKKLISVKPSQLFPI